MIFLLILTFFAFFWIVLNEVYWVGDTFFLMEIPTSFRFWTLMIVFGNSLMTYLFEKVIVYQIQICDQRRLEAKRLRIINNELAEAKTYCQEYK